MPPIWAFFCCWLQHSPSLCAGSHLSGLCFLPGIWANPAERQSASKPLKTGFFSTSTARWLPLPVLGWGTHHLLSGHLLALWKHSIFTACAQNVMAHYRLGSAERWTGFVGAHPPPDATSVSGLITSA